MIKEKSLLKMYFTSTLHDLVKLALNMELRVLRIHVLEFDGNFLASQYVDGY